MEHSPTPWTTKQSKESRFIRIKDANGRTVAYVDWSHNDCPLAIDNIDTAHIVKCVNAHDELVAALSILTQPQYHLETTPMGFTIFRLPLDKVRQISETLAKLK